jgi:beta-N-acetylhexosaminidase
VAPRAFICGLAGTELSGDESAFLRDAQPWGVILFKRNIENLAQVRRLCASAREALGREDTPVLIDQEGGRVQRIGPPHLRAYPAGALYGELYRKDPLLGVEAAHLGARLIALDLLSLGITIDCLPCLDIPVAGMTTAIGDRTLGTTVDSVSTLGGAQIDGLMSGGLLPVVKHMPGHGRAVVDSHTDLPRVDAPLSELEAQDFAPFRLLAPKAPLGMTVHVVFTAIDDAAPATMSASVILNHIRHRIGFNGALMTDDISMGALTGSLRSRAEAALGAGCDLVLHCNGALEEMKEIAAGSPVLQGEALHRTEAALAHRRPPDEADRPALEARFDYLIGKAVAA